MVFSFPSLPPLPPLPLPTTTTPRESRMRKSPLLLLLDANWAEPDSLSGCWCSAWAGGVLGARRPSSPRASRHSPSSRLVTLASSDRLLGGFVVVVCACLDSGPLPAMALEGCNACLKYLMIIWNFLILLLGLAILGIGVWVVVDKESGKFVDDLVDSSLTINYSRVSDANLFQLIGYLLIGLGVVVVVIALLGLCGALRESQCLLGTCFVVLFIIFGALLGVGIWVYIERDNMDVDKEKLHPYLKEILDEAVANYGKDEQSKKFMDAVQKKFECCGSEKGILDYGVSLSPGMIACVGNLNQPCLPKYYDYVQEHIGLKQFFSGRMTVTVGVALGLAGALVLAMVFTLILCCAVRRSGSY